jgi:hypothetical protein
MVPPGGAPLVAPPGSAPLVAPPGSAPVATSAPQPVYEEPRRPAKKKEGPIVVRGEIDEATAAAAGLKKGGNPIVKAVTAVVPLLFFFYVGSVAGDLYFRGKVEELSKKEKETLWKSVRAQEVPAKALVESLKKKVETKLSEELPEAAIKKTADLVSGANLTGFFPADGLYLPTTPFIDNGKKDTDVRYIGALLDYQEALSIFLIRAKLHADTTKQEQEKLATGFDFVRRRAKEDEGNPEFDPPMIAAALRVAKYTQAPFKGYALELMENNQAKLVIVFDTEMADSPNGEPQVSSYKVYDIDFGSTPPTDEKQFRTLDKTKVAVIDPRNTRTFLLSRDTTPVEGYFLRTYYLLKAGEQIYAGQTDAAESLQKAYTGEALEPQEPKKKETASPAGEAPGVPGEPAAPGAPAGAPAAPAAPGAPAAPAAPAAPGAPAAPAAPSK